VLVPAGSEVTVINLLDEPLVVLLVASPPPVGGTGDDHEWAADEGSSPNGDPRHDDLDPSDDDPG
jgi:hypothetical protein